jgi:hypothetical protein
MRARHLEEVATMGTNYMTRPSVLLSAACSPSAPSPAASVLAPEWAPVSRVHQVQTQAELALVDGRTNGINGTTGFMGLGISGSAAGNNGSAASNNGSAASNNGSAASKQYSDERGIPPRGRPV